MIINKQLKGLLFQLLLKFHAKNTRLARQSQIVQSTIYSSAKVVTQALTPAIFSHGSQLGLLLFPEYEQTKP